MIKLVLNLNKWPVGEMVNTQASQACIHGFKSRTGHQKRLLSPVDLDFLYRIIFIYLSNICYLIFVKCEHFKITLKQVGCVWLAFIKFIKNTTLPSFEDGVVQ